MTCKKRNLRLRASESSKLASLTALLLKNARILSFSGGSIKTAASMSPLAKRSAASFMPICKIVVFRSLTPSAVNSLLAMTSTPVPSTPVATFMPLSCERSVTGLVPFLWNTHKGS